MTRKKRFGRVAIVIAALAAGLILPAQQTEAKEFSIDNTKDEYAIQSDVKVTGSGTGYHAKLVYVARGSAISYGIQHDEFASAPYTGRDELMVENVYSNDAGRQEYDWLGVTLEPGKTYRLMLSLDKKGKATVYLDGKALRTYQNDGLKTKTSSNIEVMAANPMARVEGSGRKNGDTIRAQFNNISIKDGKYRDFKKYQTTNMHVEGKQLYPYFLPEVTKANPTLKVSMPKKNSVKITGSISGLAEGMDWDSAYEDVSGLVQYIRNISYFPPKGHKDHY